MILSVAQFVLTFIARRASVLGSSCFLVHLFLERAYLSKQAAGLTPGGVRFLNCSTFQKARPKWPIESSRFQVKLSILLGGHAGR